MDKNTWLPLIGKWKTPAIVVLLVVTAWCVRQWQPERQVRLHQDHLLEAAGKRDLQKLKEILDDGFQTSGGQDKTAALQQLAEGLRYFFSLEISGSETQISVGPAEAIVSTRLRMNGRGVAAADAMQDLVNSSKDPFLFTWQQKSWKPWDWRLVYAGHPFITSAATGEWVF